MRPTTLPGRGSSKRRACTSFMAWWATRFTPRAAWWGGAKAIISPVTLRSEEGNNIAWARQLEEAGVHVVYGLVGYKIHAKSCLVVRREGHNIRRYVHLATGNYNPTTAKLYTDLGLFTCRPEFGEDVTNFFNLLTGICQFQSLRKLVAAPFELHDRLLSLVERETQNARQGLPARIILKINSLADRQVI